MVFIVLVDRDINILKEVGRWKCCLGRHIKDLVNFSGVRACDRRLKVLIDSEYLKRQKILYGFPYIYSLTHKSRMLLNLNKREDKIRIEQISHDILVVDVVVSLLKQKQLLLETVASEKEMHIQDGFGKRQHQPDFLYRKDNEVIAVEIELSLKSISRLEKNIKDNFLNYNKQIWFIERKNQKLFNNINNFINQYPNISIIYLEELENAII